MLLVIVLFWWRNAVAEEELKNKQKRNSYWYLLLGMELWNEFWVGFCANLYALIMLTQGIESQLQSQIVGWAAGVVLDIVMYPLPPLTSGCCRGCVWLPGLLAIGIGSYWGSCALITAYSASGLAVAGQHVFLNGIVPLNLINREVLCNRLFEHFEKASPYSNVPSNEQRQGRA